MKAPGAKTTLRCHLGRASSMAAALPIVLLAALSSPAQAVEAASGAASRAAVVERTVTCGNDRGAVFADLPRTWHRVLRTSRRCAWEAPDGEHWMMLQAHGATMATLRADRRAGDGHYVENRWHQRSIWGLANGHVWDHGLTVDGHRNRYRSVGAYGTRITYIARHGTFDKWADVFHVARTSSGLAG